MHPCILQSKHPGIEPQTTHTEFYTYLPVSHWQIPETKTKDAFVSHLSQFSSSVHLRHPTAQV